MINFIEVDKAASVSLYKTLELREIHDRIFTNASPKSIKFVKFHPINKRTSMVWSIGH